MFILLDHKVNINALSNRLYTYSENYREREKIFIEVKSVKHPGVNELICLTEQLYTITPLGNTKQKTSYNSNKY